MLETQTRMESVSDNLKALGDRYAFYNFLISEQKRELAAESTQDVTEKPFGKNGGSIGVQTFSTSKAVMSDIAAGTEMIDSCDKAPVLLGTYIEWSPTFTAKTADGGTDAVFCWIRVTANNPHDNERKVTNAPAIGKNKAQFYFESGGTRYGTWTVELKTVRFSPELYPFRGLQQ